MIEIEDEREEIMDGKDEFFNVEGGEMVWVKGSIDGVMEIMKELGKEFGREGMIGGGKGAESVEKTKREREIKERVGWD